MSYAPNQYTGDGSTTSFAVSFTQYSWTSVGVSVNGTNVTTGWTYNSATSSVVFDTAPVADAVIVIRRVSSVDLLYKFGQGAAFTGANVDADFAQYQSAIEEVQNAADAVWVQTVLDAETAARQAGDASLQEQISNVIPPHGSELSIISWHGQHIGNSMTIPDNVNAFSVGPQVTIEPGQVVTIGSGSTWNILGNAFSSDELYNVTANNLTTEDGTVTVPVANLVVDSDLDVYAPLASPALTGTPTAPTAAAGTNTTQIATMAALYAATVGFGLGSASTTALTDLNSPTQTGFYKFSTSATNAPNTYGGTLLHHQYTSTYASQIAVVISNVVGQYNRTYTRAFSSGTWTSWREVAYTDSPTFTGTVTIPTLSLTNASPLPGVTDASSAAAGKIGEVITATGSGVAMASSSTAYNVTSITLTAGDWDVSGIIRLVGSAALTSLNGSISTTSGAVAGFPNMARIQGVSSVGPFDLTIPTVRFNVTTSTTVYLVGQSAFASGSGTADGKLYARRVR